ncbi:exosome complex component RRP43-like [Crassostrea virginica]|uniref:Ribosomal RNA-processing protein 43 n=1 Tax=Crassostrea virginica TaxID=6565 RepID=A0A8B8DAH1_CRAVI|nr:exosome complex component RRP43-like [Crassostrea virginica]
MADDFRTARPKEYFRKFLEQEVRPDGRELGETRTTVINVGCLSTANGSALVKIGNTAVMCGIKAELAKPKTEEPSSGFLVPNVELSPMCSPQFRPGLPGEQARVLSQFMLEVIKNSKCIDVQKLCIVSGKLVWTLYCDIVCLDYDGNVTDACVLSLLAALNNTTLPKVTLNEDTDKFEAFPEQPSALELQSNPVSSTYAIFDDEILFVDPTAEEENLATGQLTIVTIQDKLCMVHKPGGTPLTDQQLSLCIKQAFKRSTEVLRLIDDTLSSVER